MDVLFCEHPTLQIFSARRDLITFSPSVKIIELPPSRPAASRCPLDICIEMGSSPFPYSCKIKETSKKDVSFILWTLNTIDIDVSEEK